MLQKHKFRGQISPPEEKFLDSNILIRPESEEDTSILNTEGEF